MADPFTLMIGQVALSGVSSFVQAGMASANAEAAYAANDANQRFIEQDAARQKRENIESYQQAKSDRVMKANQEISAAQLMAMERGSSGTTLQSMVRHLAMVEGIDLSRIQSTYRSKQDAIDSQVEAGAIQRNQANQQAYNQARTQQTNAILSGIGSGLQIGGQYMRQQSSLKAATNKH